MRRFREKKIEISNYPRSITIEAFRRHLLRNSDLFTKLTKIIPYTMDGAYKEAKKFINLERELKLGRKGKLVMKATMEKEKRKISSNKFVQDKVFANNNKRFALNHRKGSQWSRNPRP